MVLINELVAGVAPRGTARLVFFFKADRYKKHCHFFPFVVLCSLCLVLFLFLFRLFQVIHGLLDRTMQLLEVPYSEDHTSAHGYYLKAHEGISILLLWQFERFAANYSAYNLPQKCCLFYFQTFRFLYPPFPAIQKVLSISTSVERVDFTYDIVIRSLIHLLTRPLTYFYFRWNFLPWSLCTNHRQGKANRNHGSSAPWSRQQLRIESAMRSAWTGHRGIPLKR